MSPRARHALAGTAALSLGFGLSFVGLGLLWIAMAWVVQAAMALPYAAAAYGLGRWSGDPRRVATLLLVGLAPIGLLLTQFRNAEGSHLAPTLVVAAWVAGVLLGTWLARRRPASPSP